MIHLLGVWPSWLHWLESTFYPESGRWYAVGSSWAGATAIFSGGVMIYRHKQCHEPWCWRIGKHPVEGTPFTTCHRHHPGLKGTRVQRGHIRAAHGAHIRRQRVQSKE
jgi:hypothetical protein